MSSRLTKNEYFLGIAEAVAKRSTCIRRQYGAVIVKDDVIVSTGYNGSPRNVTNCCDVGEIKKGLEQCCDTGVGCSGCPYDNDCHDPLCTVNVEMDAVKYIQQLESDNESKQKRIDELESRLAQVECERDALLNFIKTQIFPAVLSDVPEACRLCRNYDGNFTKDVCKWCGTHEVFGNFQWRGVCAENTKDGANV